MNRKLILLLLIIGTIANCEELNSCKDDYITLEGGSVNITKYCKGRKCFMKCCGKSEIYNVNKNSCEHYIKSLDFPDINIYKTNVEKKVEKSNMKLNKDFEFLINKKLQNSNCTEEVKASLDEDVKAMSMNYYILENGEIVFEIPNFYERWAVRIKMTDYCLDYMAYSNNTTKPTVGMLYVDTDKEPEDPDIADLYTVPAYIISIIFMSLVLVVHYVLIELRKKMFSLILMAYLSSLILVFTCKIIQSWFQDYDRVVLCAFLYFGVLSSFSWMKIMSFDVWWSFRAEYKRRSTNRRGVLNKFMWYCLYAWGIPVLMAIFIVMMDAADLDASIVKPHLERGFFLEMDTLLYVYVPLLILISFNILFFLLTIFNIWRLDRSINKYTPKESGRSKSNRNRLTIYLKLFFILGISWVLEVIKAFYKLRIWWDIIIDVWNISTGVAIFVIFVLKRSVLNMLCKRFSIDPPRFLQPPGLASTYTNNTSKGSTSKGDQNVEEKSTNVTNTKNDEP